MTSSAPGARDGSADTTGGHDADADAVIAVDCNGADLGPAEVAAGAAIAAGEGARTILFGPALELRQAVRDAPVDMIELVDAPV